MEEYQKRVVDEKKALDELLSRLTSFFDTELYAGLPEDERDDMRAQWHGMCISSIALRRRIRRFE